MDTKSKMAKCGCGCEFKTLESKFKVGSVFFCSAECKAKATGDELPNPPRSDWAEVKLI